MHINWDLLAKYISGECSPDEEHIIKQRMKSDPTFAEMVTRLEAALQFRQVPAKSIDIDASWQQLQNKIILENARAFYKKQNVRKMPRFIPRPQWAFQILKYAAGLVFAVLASYYVSDGFQTTPWGHRNSDEYEVKIVQNGERINLSLADGSYLTVDAGSEIKYFTDYDQERHVYLRGEACFNVATDPQRPFYVHANQARVRVVGTRFNVRSWDINPNVIVTVLEGKVNISREDSLETKSIMLGVNEQSIIPKSGPLIKTENIDAEKYFKWMQNEIHFENCKVREVIAQLERWYDYKFKFQNEAALEQEISIHIRGANVNEVISVISAVTHTEVRRDQNYIEFLEIK